MGYKICLALRMKYGNKAGFVVVQGAREIIAPRFLWAL